MWVVIRMFLVGSLAWMMSLQDTSRTNIHWFACAIILLFLGAVFFAWIVLQNSREKIENSEYCFSLKWPLVPVRANKLQVVLLFSYLSILGGIFYLIRDPQHVAERCTFICSGLTITPVVFVRREFFAWSTPLKRCHSKVETDVPAIAV